MTDLRLLTLGAIRYPLKVIACSEGEEARREALAAGVSAFVGKEEPLNHLMNVLRLVGGMMWLLKQTSPPANMVAA